MESYEKKYKEALERARICHKDMSNLDGVTANMAKDFFEEVFPELRESEDERIRKEIIAVFKGEISYTSEEDAQKYIAWLEKQKEYKSIQNEEDEKIRDEICIYIGAKQDISLDIHNRWLTWLEKQGEKETDEWKEGNIIRHGGIIALVIKGRRAMKSNGEIFTVQYPDEWVKALPIEIEHFFNEFEKLGEEKPSLFETPETPIKDTLEVSSRMQSIDDDLKPIADFIIDYASWNLHKEEWSCPTLTVPLFRVLDALIQRGKPYIFRG